MRDESTKTVKIMRLENLALYGTCVYIHVCVCEHLCVHVMLGCNCVCSYGDVGREREVSFYACTE